MVISCLQVRYGLNIAKATLILKTTKIQVIVLGVPVKLEIMSSCI